MKKLTIHAFCLLAFSGLLSAQERTVAVLNGENIKKSEIDRKLWLNYSNRAIQEVVDEKLLLQEAARAGVKAEKKEVDERIAAVVSNFKDKADFLKALKAVGLTEKDYARTIENQILINNAVLRIKKLAVTEADAKAFYENNKAQFKMPESARLRQIFVKSRQEADDAYLAIQAGASFEKLAELKSGDENVRRNKGDLGYISRGMLLPEIEKAVFSLKAGEITAPIQTGNGGFTIIKAEELKPAQDLGFEAVKENLRLNILNQLLTEKKTELLNELKAKARLEMK